MINKYLTILFCLLLFSSIAWANSPFEDFFNLPTLEPVDETPPSEILEDTSTIPFLQAFLVVYEDDGWIYSSPDSPFYSFEVLPPATDYAMNATECCGTWIMRDQVTSDIIFDGLFCLRSTWDNRLWDKERTMEIKCIGVRGARLEKSIHPALKGYAIDDPTMIDCRTFRLIRPE